MKSSLKQTYPKLMFIYYHKRTYVSPKVHALEAWSFGTLRVARNFKVGLIERSLNYRHWSLLFGPNYLVRSLALPNVPILMRYCQQTQVIS